MVVVGEKPGLLKDTINLVYFSIVFPKPEMASPATLSK